MMALIMDRVPREKARHPPRRDAEHEFAGGSVILTDL